MLPATKAILLMFFAYLAGGIPFGYIIAMAYGSIDIREHGSGNIGMTNVFRTLGPLPGLVTLVLDVLKGWFILWLALIWIKPADWGDDYMLWAILICMIALFAVVGHSFTIWLGFKGGKSVAVSLGVLSALMGTWIFVPLLIFVIIVALTRYVSLGSMISAVSVPIIFMIWKTFPESGPAANWVFILFTWLLAITVLIRHQSNIKRLLKGNENRVGIKKKKPKPAEIPDVPTPDSVDIVQETDSEETETPPSE